MSHKRRIVEREVVGLSSIPAASAFVEKSPVGEITRDGPIFSACARSQRSATTNLNRLEPNRVENVGHDSICQWLFSGHPTHVFGNVHRHTMEEIVLTRGAAAIDTVGIDCWTPSPIVPSRSCPE